MLADRFDQPGFAPAAQHNGPRGCAMVAQLIATVSLVVSIVVVTIAFVSVAAGVL